MSLEGQQNAGAAKPARARPQRTNVDGNGILEQLERILASRYFSGSPRMCRFLRVAVEYALAGRAGELKEYLLGAEIFDRNDGFDPRVDPIVRVEARRLRAKLKSYYDGEGARDRIVIELPVGTYAPRFAIRDANARQTPTCAPQSSIAVLPFANLNPEPDTEYFSDGLTEELTHALTNIEGLRVVAWNSSVRLKNAERDFTRVAEELGAGSVLVGSVRASAGRLRVIARLADTSSGQYLWSQTYDRALEDVFAIQEEISKAIAASLSAKLLDRQPGRATDPRAYDLYLRGRFHWNKRTPDGLRLATSLFQQAIDADPGYAAGWAGLADALTLNAEYGSMRSLEAVPTARDAALKALELDPSLAEPYASLALIASLYDRHWDEAERYYRRAIELNPSYVTAHHWYACDYLSLRGRPDEALKEIAQAVVLDPLSKIMREGVVHILTLARRYDEALERLGEVFELDPYFYKFWGDMGRIYIQKGEFARGIEMLEKARSLAGDIPSVLGALGQGCALAGRASDARALLARLSEMARERYVASSTFALIHCGLGETERALEWLEFACERRELSLNVIKVHPAYDALRPFPRFRELVRQIGLEA